MNAHANEMDRRTAVAIDVDRENGLLQITWADSHESLYQTAYLRRRCPCALCAGEMGRPGAVDRDTVFTPRQTTLQDVELLNRFGVQFIWGDGHDDGLYSYIYLRDLCPCDECAAERISRP